MIVFPDLAGLKYDRKKTPTFKTQIKEAVNGYEARTSLMAFPIWKFELDFEFLRENAPMDELRTLAGFFLQARGAFSTWLFSDPSDNSVDNQVFGVGNGVSKDFQLIRNFGGFVDIVQAPNEITITINGVPTTAFTEDKGVIKFTNAPANGASIAWNGTFYFPCRFEDDSIEFNNFMHQLWEAKKVSFRSVKL